MKCTPSSSVVVTTIGSITFILLAGCGASRPAGRTGDRARSPSPASAPRASTSVTVAPMVRRVVMVVGTERGGARDVINGTVRARIDATSVTFADEGFGASVTSAGHTADGWVFVTNDGVISRSATFLGPLERVGELPEGAFGEGWTPPVEGRAYVTYGRQLWTTANAERLAPVASLAGRSVRQARFGDASHGVVLLEDGSVLRTSDGCRTWTPVDLGGDVAMNAVARDGGIALATTAGPRAVSADGALTPTQDVAAFDRPFYAPMLSRAEDYHRFNRALWSHYPILLDPVWQRRAGHGPLAWSGTSLVEVAPDTGTLRTVGTLPNGSCTTVLPWGDGYAARCDGESWWSADGAHFERIELFFESPRLSEDGQWAVEGCGLDSLCAVRSPRGRLEALEVPGLMRPSVLALQRGTLLVSGLWRRADHDVVQTTLAVRLDAPGSSRPLVTIGEDGETPVGSARTARFTESGFLTVIEGDPDEGVATCYVGALDAPLTRVTLPEGAHAASFADRDRGLAVGAALWRTTDGGSHWERLLQGAWVGGAEVVCDDVGCSAWDGETILRVAGWTGPVALHGHGRAILTAQSGPGGAVAEASDGEGAADARDAEDSDVEDSDANEARDPVFDSTRRVQALSCTSGAWTPLPGGARNVRRRAGGRIVDLHRSDSIAHLSIWQDAQGRAMAEVAWRVHDGRRWTSGHAGPSEWSPAGDAEHDLTIHAASARTLLLGSYRELWVATAATGIRAVALGTTAHQAVSTAMIAPSGDVAVELGYSSASIFLLLAPDGSVAARRAMIRQGDLPSLAWSGADVGVLSRRGDEVTLARLSPGGAATPSVLPPVRWAPGSVSPCAGSAPAAVITAMGDFVSLEPAEGQDDLTDGVATLEVRADGLCVREIVTRDRPGRNAATYRVTSVDSRTVAGIETDGTRARTLRCTVPE